MLRSARGVAFGLAACIEANARDWPAFARSPQTSQRRAAAGPRSGSFIPERVPKKKRARKRSAQERRVRKKARNRSSSTRLCSAKKPSEEGADASEAGPGAGVNGK